MIRTQLTRSALATLICTGLASGLARAQESTGKPAAGGAAAAQVSSASVSLKPMFKAGEAMNFVQRIKRSDTMSLPGMGEQAQTMDQTMAWEGKVASTDAEKTVIELQLKSIKAESTESMKQGDKDGEEKKSSWDSSTPADDKDDATPLFTLFKPYVGSKFKLTVDATGLITGVEQDPPMTVPTTRTAQFARQIVDPDAIRTRLQPMICARVGKGAEASKTGDAWDDVLLLPSPPVGKLKITTKRTLKSVDAGVANIEIAGAMEMLGMKDDEPAQGSVKESSISGGIKWDVKAGAAKSLTWTQKSVTAVNAQGFAVTRGSDWTMTIERK